MSDAIPKIRIDDVEYALEDLSDEAKAQLTNLQVVDQKIAATQQELAILQTARTAYAGVLKAAMPNN